MSARIRRLYPSKEQIERVHALLREMREERQKNEMEREFKAEDYGTLKLSPPDKRSGW